MYTYHFPDDATIFNYVNGMSIEKNTKTPVSSILDE